MELNLTISQNELLFEIAEIHLKWYKLYYDDPPSLLRYIIHEILFISNQKQNKRNDLYWRTLF